MSKASGKQSAQSLDSPEDEVGDLFCLGWIHVEIAANLLNILDGPVKINHAIVAHHRDDGFRNLPAEHWHSSRYCRPS